MQDLRSNLATNLLLYLHFFTSEFSSKLAQEVDIRDGDDKVYPTSPSSPVKIEDEDDAVVLANTTVANCLKLAEWVQKKQVGDRKEVATQSTSLPPILTSDADEKLNYQFALEENIRLRAILNEATSANKRWQQCYAECQKYMQKLVDMVRELRDREPTNSQLGDQVTAPNRQQRERLATSNNSVASAEQVATLQHLNEQLISEMDTMRSELEQCRRKLAENAFLLERSEQEHNEHVELLEMQLQGHRDDFEAESKEKTSLHKKNAELLEEVRIAKLKIQELQYRTDSCMCHGGGPFTEPNVRPRPRMTYNIPPDNHCVLISRSPSGISQIIVADGSDDKTESDSATGDAAEPRQRQRSPSPSASGTARPPNTFSCPGCSLVFPQEKHVQFLEHFEKCCCLTVPDNKMEKTDSC